MKLQGCFLFILVFATLPSLSALVEIEADYIALFQGNTGQSGNAIVSTTNGITSDPVDTELTQREMEKKYTEGLQVVLSLSDADFYTLEFHFLGLAQWRKITGAHSEAAILVTNLPNSMDLDAWFMAANVESNYRQFLNYGDIEAWFHSTPRGDDYFCLSWMAGPRFLEYRDRLKLTSQHENDISRMNVNCKNHLIGPILGGEFFASPLSYFCFIVRADGGIYANFIDRSYILRDINDTEIVADTKTTSTKAAYSIGINPSIQLHCGQYFKFCIGYQARYFANIAQAPLQVATDISSTSLYWKSNFTFQAATVGFALHF